MTCKATPLRHREDLCKFHARLPGYSRTRLASLSDLARDMGIKALYIKDESTRFGLPSFKILGASWGIYRALIDRLDFAAQCSLEELRAAAQAHKLQLFAATDGNHGRAVAWMAKLLRIRAVIYIPKGVDDHTRQLISAEGSDVILLTESYDHAVATAAEAAHRQGGILVQDTAFGDYEQIPAWIVEGYSTMFDEIDAQLKELNLHPTTVITPVGVGSLASAAVSFAKSDGRHVKVVTVEPNTAACLHASLRASKPVSIHTTETIMTGMNCGTVSAIAWPLLRDNVDLSITVSDSETHIAVQDLASSGISAGPCGAAGLAALRQLVGDDMLEDRANAVVVLLNTEGIRDYVMSKT